ncbi:unnamed protein product, partial [Medioppia subpectinata]
CKLNNSDDYINSDNDYNNNDYTDSDIDNNTTPQTIDDGVDGEGSGGNPNPIDSSAISDPDEAEEVEDEYDSGQEVCTPLDALQGLNISDFLPEDYESLKSEPRHRVVRHFDETWGRFQRFFKWEHRLYDNPDLKAVANYLLGLAYELSYDFALEPECSLAITSLLQGLNRKEIWAFKFIDSQPHPMPTGFWGGIISELGQYDQCLDIQSPRDDRGQTVAGQYCMLQFVLPYPLVSSYDRTFEDNPFATQLKNFTEKYGFGGYSAVNPMLKLTEYLNMRNGKFFEFGICIPDKCHPKDIEKEFNRSMCL